MIPRVALLLLTAVSGCITTHGDVSTGGWTGLALDLPAPHACRALKGSVVVGVGGAATVLGLSFNGLDPDDSPIAMIGLVAMLGGGVAAGLTSRSCFSQMNRAAERSSYRPPPLSPEQQSQLDRVKAEEASASEAQP